MAEERKAVSMYKRMLEIRRFEERVVDLYKQGLIPGVAHLYIGEEAVAVGVCTNLRRDDYVVSTHRAHGHSLAKGMDPGILMAELFGKASGCCGGVGGSMHSTDLQNGILFSTAIVGSGIPIAVGAGLSVKLENKSRVIVSFFGEGAVNTGSFHEALNLASLWELPVMFVCENNLYGLSTHVENATSTEDIADRATAYDIPRVAVDGNDVQAVQEASLEASERAREGGGPTLLECKTYRWTGHHIREDWRSDLIPYRSKGEIESWKKRCPVKAFREKLLGAGILTREDVDQIENAVTAKIDEAEEFAKQSSYPSLEVTSKSVYRPQRTEQVEHTRAGDARDIKFHEAINEALREEMKRDDKVFLLGEDIGRYGGIFNATRELIEEFGPERVRDTPISETAIIGAAIGSALTGMRPVAEIMYMDFLTCAMDQILNHAAKIHYMTAGQLKLPMVIRTQSSIGRLMGAQHSQFFPAALTQFPGLKIVLPSTPYDAKGLLKTAVRDDNPVLFIETGQLYGRSGLVPRGEYALPFGKLEIKKQGEDVTVVAISNMVHKALTAAAEVLKEGIDVEVIDLRTLVPLDRQGVIESVKKTGRLIVAEESCKTGGVGAEVSASVTEQAFDYLDAPILRVAAPDTPAPFSPNLSDVYVPSEKRLVAAINGIVG